MSLPDLIGKTLWKQGQINKTLLRPLYKRLSRRVQADYPFEVDFFGLRYQGNLNNNIDYSVFFFGAFEKPVLFFMRDVLRKLALDNGVFLDVGANVGQHSLFMSLVAATVHAFEPYPPVRAVFERRVQHNLLHNIHIHPVGLSAVSGSALFFAPAGRNQGRGSFVAQTQEKGNWPLGELALVKGDDYPALRDLSALHLIKMDVEGFEKLALQGLTETLAKHRPVLIFELTYGRAESFGSTDEIVQVLPVDYELFVFSRVDHQTGSGRQYNARARFSGEYNVVPYTNFLGRGQDDIVAVPTEKLNCLKR